MPAPNDLTPEEEAEFIQHGVQPSGPGREPVSNDQGQQQQEPGQQQQEPAHGDRAPARDPATGKFTSADQGQQGQQQEPGQEGGGDQGQEPKMVPHAALHAERLKTSELARRAQLAETRMNALIAAQQQQRGGEEAPQMPSLEDDPAGYIVALEQRLARFESGRAEEQQFRQIDTALENDENLFSQSVPDYGTASDYYVQSRAKELLRFYPPEEAQRLMVHEARAIANEAWKRGQSAGETIYALAMARGYNPNAPQRQPDQGQQQQQGQGQQQQQGRSATAVVESIRRGQEQSRSLSGGAASRTGQLNAEALLNMSDEEFEEHLALGSKGANARFAAIG